MTSATIYLETMGCQMNVLDSELVMGEMMSRGYLPSDDMVSADLVVLNTCSVRQHAEDKVWSRLGELRRAKRKQPGKIIAVIGCMAERDGQALLERVPHVDVLCGPTELNRLPALVDDVISARASGGQDHYGHANGQLTTRHADAPRAIALSGALRGHSTPVVHVTQHDDLESLDSSRASRLDLSAAPAAGGSHQAYVRITRGCNKFCTFCVVPFTRGMEQHRPPDQIVQEVRRLCAAGVREVTLLGQTVNHYEWVDDKSRRTDFAMLLRRVHDEVPELPRLRFVTSYPRDFTDDALRVMAESPRICKYLHIPAQSGSNTVLRRMNRGYTIEQYRGLLERARSLMPDLAIAGDMIVGFSGETDDDFAASVDLIHHARYKNCFIFKYSPRPGTSAFDRLPDDVPNEVKRRRNNDLLAAQAEVNLANHRELIGQTVQVLIEGPSKAQIKRQESEQERGGEVAAGSSAGGNVAGRVQLVGRTSGDQIVVFDGPRGWIGRMMAVEIVAVTPYTLHGRSLDTTSTIDEPVRPRDKSIALPVMSH